MLFVRLSMSGRVVMLPVGEPAGELVLVDDAGGSECPTTGDGGAGGGGTGADRED